MRMIPLGQLQMDPQHVSSNNYDEDDDQHVDIQLPQPVAKRLTAPFARLWRLSLSRTRRLHLHCRTRFTWHGF